MHLNFSQFYSIRCFTFAAYCPYSERFSNMIRGYDHWHFANRSLGQISTMHAQLHNELTLILLEQTDYHMHWIGESGGIEKTEEKGFACLSRPRAAPRGFTCSRSLDWRKGKRLLAGRAKNICCWHFKPLKQLRILQFNLSSNFSREDVLLFAMTSKIHRMQTDLVSWFHFHLMTRHNKFSIRLFFSSSSVEAIWKLVAYSN